MNAPPLLSTTPPFWIVTLEEPNDGSAPTTVTPLDVAFEFAPLTVMMRRDR